MDLGLLLILDWIGINSLKVISLSKLKSSPILDLLSLICFISDFGILADNLGLAEITSAS